MGMEKYVEHKISGLQGSPIETSDHFSPGAGVKRVVEDFKKSPKGLIIMLGKHAQKPREISTRKFNNTNRIDLGEIRIEVSGPKA